MKRAVPSSPPYVCLWSLSQHYAARRMSASRQKGAAFLHDIAIISRPRSNAERPSRMRR